MQNLRLVEIELFNYCNRKCEWCPNSFIDRTSNFEYLSYDLFKKIIDELKYNNYKGIFSFSRYNEPLRDPYYLNYIVKYIKEKLPNCKCVTNTNGDYINEEVIDSLKIDELTIMDYNNEGRKNCVKKLKEWGTHVIRADDKFIYAEINKMKILYYLDWKLNNHITDRGGALKEYIGQKRINPCYEPKYFIGINYDGTVSPCCNIRNDCETTAPYILGDLNHNSLTEILSSEYRKIFIKKCSEGDFSELKCCQTCENCGGRYTREKGEIFYE